MTIPVPRHQVPMLARAAEAIPTGEGWLYEPKWDGFRALVFREHDDTVVASRNGLDLGRYFPEIVTLAVECLPPQCVVDGEIVIAGKAGLDFDALQLRLHPAASRVRRLAEETPAWLIGFDLLATGSTDLRSAPLHERRAALRQTLIAHPRVGLTPQTDDPELASSWFQRFEGAGLDGVVAKRTQQPYLGGERGWIKVKHHRTADCVVAGYRLASSGDGVGSLLLGLHDQSGTLHHVGHTSSFTAAQRRELVDLLRPHQGGGGFGAGRTPGSPSRWTAGRDSTYVGLRPDLVCEVHFDQLQGDRFRHAARFLRWRDDKAPADCDYDQLTPPQPFELGDIITLGRR